MNENQKPPSAPSTQIGFTDLVDAFEEVVRHETEALTAARGLTKHLKKISKLEAEHSRLLLIEARNGERDLQQASKGVSSWQLALLGSSISLSQLTSNISSSVLENVCKPLSKILKELVTELKQIEIEGERLSHDFKTAVSKYERTKILYLNKQQVPQPQQPSLSASSGPISSPQQDPITPRLKNAFIEAANEAEKQLKRHQEGTKNLLEALRNVDRRRIATLTSYVRKYLALKGDIPGRERDQLMLIDDALAKSNPENEESIISSQIRLKVGPQIHQKYDISTEVTEPLLTQPQSSGQNTLVLNPSTQQQETIINPNQKMQKRRSRIWTSLAKRLGGGGGATSGNAEDNSSSALSLSSSLGGSTPDISPAVSPLHISHHPPPPSPFSLISSIPSPSPSDSPKRTSSSTKNNEQQQQQQQPPQGVLGITLEGLMQRQQEVYPKLEIPIVLILLKDTLVHIGAKSMEGIFRIPGNQQYLNMYKTMLSSPLHIGGVGCEKYFRLVKGTTPATVAALFKFFIRELPTPVIPSDLYDAFTNRDFISKLTPQNFSEVVLSKITPEVHRKVFSFVLTFLADVSRLSVANRMGPENLAMVFAPCLLRCPSDNPVAMLQLYELEKLFVCRSISMAIESGCGEELETAIVKRPDGTAYDGNGFEFVDDDPLVSKFIEPLPQTIPIPKQTSEQQHQETTQKSSQPNIETPNATNSNQIVVIPANATTILETPPHTPERKEHKHHTRRRSASNATNSPSILPNLPLISTAGDIATSTNNNTNNIKIKIPTVVPALPPPATIVSPTTTQQQQQQQQQQGEMTAIKSPRANRSVTNEENERKHNRTAHSPYRHRHHTDEPASSKKHQVSDQDAADHVEKLARNIRKARDEHKQLDSALIIIRDKLEQASSVLEAEQLALLANTFSKQVNSNIIDILHCNQENIAEFSHTPSYTPMRPLINPNQTNWITHANSNLISMYNSASENLAKAHICLSYVGHGWLDSITSHSRAARVRSVLKTLRKFLVQQIQEVLSMLRSPTSNNNQTSPMASTTTTTPNETTPIGTPSRGSSPTLFSTHNFDTNSTGSFGDNEATNTSTSLQDGGEAAEDAAASALDSVKLRARQLRDTANSLSLRNQQGILDSNALFAFKNETEPLVRVVRELASFMRNKGISPSFIVVQPPTKSSDKNTHMISMALYYLELISAQLDAVEVFAATPQCTNESITSLARILQASERSLWAPQVKTNK